MPKGLLVDYGGVLTTSVLDSFAAFARSEGSTPEAFASAIRLITEEDADLFVRVERGALPLVEFETLLAAALTRHIGVTIAAEGLKRRLFAAGKADDAMLGAMRAARAAGVKTGLISNSWGIVSAPGEGDYPRELFAELFDIVVISGEVGMRKPDPEIYLLAADELQIEPSDCVFVDDFRVNIDGAIAVGMRGVHHRETAATLAELESFLGVSLS